jgi:hypothetical protein
MQALKNTIIGKDVGATPALNSVSKHAGFGPTG